MAYCPHCNRRYDEANETQPCCGTCGHPISCGCGGGHQYSPPSSSIPTSLRKELEEEFGDEEEPNEPDRSGPASDADSTPTPDDPKDDNDGTGETDEDGPSPLDGLPF